MRPIGFAPKVLLLLSLCGIGGSVMGQDTAAGEQVYKRNCSGCHAVEAGSNRQGPTLFGVVGRAVGTVPDYNYSSADEKAKFTWSREMLDRYLANPHKVIPGTKMVFVGLHTETERQNLIAYLATLH